MCTAGAGAGEDRVLVLDVLYLVTNEARPWLDFGTRLS